MFTRKALRVGASVLGCAALIVALGGCPRASAPTVSSTDPASGAIGVPVNRNLAVTFSEAMNPATITPTTFTLTQGTTPVPGTVTYSGVTAIFNPTNTLESNTQYTATITTGAQAQRRMCKGDEGIALFLVGFLLAGHASQARADSALAENFVWTFTTGESTDTTAPAVSSTDPANGATGVPPGRNLSATFSKAMNPLTITTATFTLRHGTTPVAGTVSYAGITAVFNPTGSLPSSTLYTATITSGATDLAGNALASDHVWTFTTGASADTTAPTVSSTNPVNGAIGVPVNMKIAAAFSEAMDPLTISTATFTVMQGTTRVAGTVTYAGVTAIFTPTGGLASGTQYTARITSAAEDLAGNALTGGHVWTFTTGGGADTTAPAVSSTDPANSATGVPINKNLSATFSEAMAPLTISTATFTLEQGTTPVTGTVTYAGVTAVFNPASPLAADTEYTATITNEADDLAGNALASEHVWSFTTGTTADTTAPTVNSTDPAGGAIDVSVNKKIAATFNEAMNPLTITTTTFTLKHGTTPVAGAVGYAGVTATFTPATTLAPNTTYTATVLMEATDVAGNGLAGDHVWTFTTGATADATAPTVSSADPIDSAIGVPLNKKVAATFSEAMDPLTITTATFTLEQGTTPVAGAVTYMGMTATFTPAAALTAGTEYTATITTGAEDLAGNAVASDHVWTFTTGTTTAQVEIDLGSANAFAILAGSTVTNTGPSIVTGDLGVSPGTAVVGFPPGILNGAIFTGVASAAGQAKLDLTAAFNDAAGRSVGPVSLPGDLSGLTLYPGLYTNSTSVMLSAGNVTLDAQGDSNAVFLFQMGSTLTTGVGTQVVLSGGAKAANVYWQVGASATLGTNSIFKGNILASASVTLTTGTALEGRALTQTAAVTLDDSAITVPAP
ncbi:MAG: Ig-like domain-containing protein [Candidatus Hydrogenedentes bacterium]|nr:Ig-like domain-containing protein [Candidatus Hydrogenedentota bacterium]